MDEPKPVRKNGSQNEQRTIVTPLSIPIGSLSSKPEQFWWNHPSHKHFYNDDAFKNSQAIKNSDRFVIYARTLDKLPWNADAILNNNQERQTEVTPSSSSRCAYCGLNDHLWHQCVHYNVLVNDHWCDTMRFTVANDGSADPCPHCGKYGHGKSIHNCPNFICLEDAYCMHRHIARHPNHVYQSPFSV